MSYNIDTIDYLSGELTITPARRLTWRDGR